MKKEIINYGGLVFFYVAIIIMLLLVNGRFDYLNNHNTQNIIAYRD